MVIFHSYVSLPEGTLKRNGYSNHHFPGIFMASGCQWWCFGVNPSLAPTQVLSGSDPLRQHLAKQLLKEVGLVGTAGVPQKSQTTWVEIRSEILGKHMVVVRFLNM